MVLENKLAITDLPELRRIEEKYSKIKAVQQLGLVMWKFYGCEVGVFFIFVYTNARIFAI